MPTARAIPRVHYAMGLAQEGLRSPAAKASFEAYVALRGDGDAHAALDDARRRATAR